MPKKAKAAAAKKSKPRATAAKRTKPKARKTAPASQFDSLRKTVSDLRTRLEKELKARKIETKILTEAKKAREQLTSQVSALRQQGAKLASELKKALSDSKSYEKAKAEAQKTIERLKKDLTVRSAELRHKSEELKNLAEESAHRVVDIIRGEGQPTQEPEPVPEGAQIETAPEEPELTGSGYDKKESSI